jgi:hypothetical protein
MEYNKWEAAEKVTLKREGRTGQHMVHHSMV